MDETIALDDIRQFVRAKIEEDRRRLPPLLRELARGFLAETVFVLLRPMEGEGEWTIPEGWLHTEKEFPATFSVPDDAEIVRSAVKAKESIVVDTRLGDGMPDAFAELNLRSVVVVALRCPDPDALLVICNGEKTKGAPALQVSYTLEESEIAAAVARIVSLDGVGEEIRKRTARKQEAVEAVQMKPEDATAWEKEKPDLLKTHPGWYVAYQGGHRVALEPSLDRLVDAMDRELGTPRKPCEVHQVLEQPPQRRGPSPRTRRPAQR